LKKERKNIAIMNQMEGGTNVYRYEHIGTLKVRQNEKLRNKYKKSQIIEKNKRKKSTKIE
jgi:hypothetical protein